MQFHKVFYVFLLVMCVMALTTSCASENSNSPIIQVTEINGISNGEALLPGTQKYVYVEASGVGNLTFTWEDVTGVLQTTGDSILNYVVPNVPGEAFLKVTVRTDSGDQKFKIVRFQIVMPTATPSLTPLPTLSPTSTFTPTLTPTAEFTPTHEMKPTVIEYTAVSGDTLSDISKEYLKSGIYGDALGRANCVDVLRAGQKITIKYYVVQDGDYLGLIADRFGMSIQFIQFINDFTGETIYPGQILILPIYGKCQ